MSRINVNEMIKTVLSCEDASQCVTAAPKTRPPITVPKRFYYAESHKFASQWSTLISRSILTLDPLFGLDPDTLRTICISYNVQQGNQCGFFRVRRFPLVVLVSDP